MNCLGIWGGSLSTWREPIQIQEEHANRETLTGERNPGLSYFEVAVLITAICVTLEQKLHKKQNTQNIHISIYTYLT